MHPNPLRQSEFKELCSRILSLGSSILLVGDHGSGKTKLLEAVGQWARGVPRLIPAKLSPAAIQSTSTIPQFWHQILLQVAREDVPSFGAKVRSAVARKFAPSAIEDVMVALREADLRLVLLMDEFQCLVEQPGLRTGEFWGTLRTVMDIHCSSFILVGASAWPYQSIRQSIAGILNEFESPFLNVMMTRTLGPLSQEEVKLVVSEVDRRSSAVEQGLVWRLGGGNLRLTSELAHRLAQVPSATPQLRVQQAVEMFWGDGADAFFEEIQRPWPPSARFSVMRVALEQLRRIGDERRMPAGGAPQMTSYPPGLLLDLHNMFVDMLNRTELRYIVVGLAVSEGVLPGEQASFSEFVEKALAQLRNEGKLVDAVKLVHGRRPMRRPEIEAILRKHGCLHWIGGASAEPAAVHFSDLHGLDLRGIVVRRGSDLWRIGPLLFLHWLATRVRSVHKHPESLHVGLRGLLLLKETDASEPSFAEWTAYFRSRLEGLGAHEPLTLAELIDHASPGADSGV